MTDAPACGFDHVFVTVSKIRVNGNPNVDVIRPFTVAPDTLTDLVLDFDACKSIVARGNGGFNLKPVVTAIPIVVSGKVVGYAPAGSRVYAERGGEVVKSTVATSEGAFTLSPIEQSSTAGNVDVVVVPPASAARGVGIIRSVPVVAGASTTVSTSTAPIAPPPSAFNTVSGTVTPLSAEASLRALQTTGGAKFEVASTFANLATGAYGMNLPAAAPVVGTYQTTLPIPLVPDATVAGRYTIEATTSTGAVKSSSVDIGTGPATRDFAF